MTPGSILGKAFFFHHPPWPRVLSALETVPFYIPEQPSQPASCLGRAGAPEILSHLEQSPSLLGWTGSTFAN